MQMSSWIARLRERTSGYQVEGAASLAEVERKPPKRDTLFVTLLARKAAGGPRMGASRQRADYLVGVTIALSNFRDARGEGAADDLETAIGQVMAALLGWAPPGGQGQAASVQGGLTAFAGGRIFWTEQFTAPGWIGQA